MLTNRVISLIWFDSVCHKQRTRRARQKENEWWREERRERAKEKERAHDRERREYSSELSIGGGVVVFTVYDSDDDDDNDDDSITAPYPFTDWNRETTPQNNFFFLGCLTGNGKDKTHRVLVLEIVHSLNQCCSIHRKSFAEYKCVVFVARICCLVNFQLILFLYIYKNIYIFPFGCSLRGNWESHIFSNICHETDAHTWWIREKWCFRAPIHRANVEPFWNCVVEIITHKHSIRVWECMVRTFQSVRFWHAGNRRIYISCSVLSCNSQHPDIVMKYYRQSFTVLKSSTKNTYSLFYQMFAHFV